MKIALVGLYYENNMGDPLLFDCSEYLIKKYDKTIEVSKIDWFGRKSKKDKFTSDKGIPILYFSLRVLRKGFSMLHFPTTYLDEWKWKFSDDKKRLKSIYEKKLKGIDGIIVMGAGTLKYDVRLNFAPYYHLLIETAEQLNIPVYINCVGVESKYNPNDKRCKMFEDALSRNIVKIVTTRDEIEELKKYIKNKKTMVDKISDIGTWASETYQIKKDKTSDIIGLGVITPERFREFGRNEVYKKYEDFWVQLIQELERKNVKWKIFNNGDESDSAFAEKLCKLVGKDVKEYILTPSNPKELVQIVSGFKGIISSRLHSCIVAYSLDVPFVAISWNNKLQYFAREIGVSQRIVEEHELSVKKVWKKYLQAEQEGYDKQYKETFRKKSKDYIQLYIKDIKGEAN